MFLKKILSITDTVYSITDAVYSITDGYYVELIASLSPIKHGTKFRIHRF